MGKKGIKQYARIASKYGTKFEGYNVPVGAIYGRVLIHMKKAQSISFLSVLNLKIFARILCQFMF